VLGHLQLLEVLALEGTMEGTMLRYNGELAGRLPCLRQLEMKNSRHEEVLSDLLRGAAGSIRLVDLHLQPLNAALRRNLELCAGLRRLCIDLDDVDVVRFMPGLHSLMLYSRHAWCDALKRLQDTLPHCSPLVALRHLELKLEFIRVPTGYWTHLAHVLTDLAAVALRTTYLHINCKTKLDKYLLNDTEECVELLVTSLPHLQVAHLVPCSRTLLQQLAGMKDLRVVEATIICPIKKHEKCKRALRDFYDKRPEVKASVCISDFNFGFQPVRNKYSDYVFQMTRKNWFV
jgi:hypothetical protein